MFLCIVFKACTVSFLGPICSTLCPPSSAWDSLMDEGWQSLITLSGTDYDPTCFLFAHIHVTLLMNYNSTQRVAQWVGGWFRWWGARGRRLVSVYMPCYSLYIERWWLIHQSDNVLTVCCDFLMNLDFKKKREGRSAVHAAETLHTHWLTPSCSCTMREGNYSFAFNGLK